MYYKVKCTIKRFMWRPFRFMWAGGSFKWHGKEHKGLKRVKGRGYEWRGWDTDKPCEITRVRKVRGGIREGRGEEEEVRGEGRTAGDQACKGGWWGEEVTVGEIMVNRKRKLGKERESWERRKSAK